MNQPGTILYAEDDANYAMLFKCTLEQCGYKHTLHHVTDGGEAIRYLKGEGKYADRTEFSIPCVVLADLKMPRVDGFELLEWIRRQPAFLHLPVVVLTSSDEVRDIQKAYRMGANSFLTKPPHLEDLRSMLRMLDGYWIKFSLPDAKVEANRP